MRGALAPIPCLVAPPALAGCTGSVVAVALTTAGHAAEISARMRRGFILGEVAAPGQYPYLSNMTVESAVAVGFSPRAWRDRDASGPARFVVPSGAHLSSGDTVLVGERGF